MRKFALALVVAVLVMAALWAVPGRGGEAPSSPSLPAAKSSSFPSVPLGLWGPAAALAQPGSTFPASEAGLAAYLRVSPLDMVKAATAFSSFRQGGNWLVGGVSVGMYPTWDVHTNKSREYVPVYIDSQGWVVAYLPRSVAPAGIMVWTGVDKENPKLEAIATTALEEALKKVVLSAGVDFSALREQVRYYHFEFPEANSIILVAKVGRGQPGVPFQMVLSIAQGLPLFSASLSAIAESDLNTPYYPYYPGYSNVRNTPYLFNMAPGASRDFELTIPENQAAGIAVAVVYKTP